LILIAVSLLTSCSTHEERFETSPPPDRGDFAATANGMWQIRSYVRPRFETMSTTALATLVAAAAVASQATGDLEHRALGEFFASHLLERQRNGAFPLASKGAAHSETTAIAGNAFVDAFLAWKRPRYAEAARNAAAAVTSPRLGWLAGRRKSGVVAPARREGIGIAPTASAFGLLWRGGIHLGRRFQRQSDAALTTIVRSQAAVGRWYGGTRTKRPMSLLEWAVTLDACARARGTDGERLAGGGVRGLWSAAFHPSGVPRHNSLTAGAAPGLAASLALFAGYADARYANAAFARGLDRIKAILRRTRGEERARAEAYLALAFARRLAELKKQFN
jgi:hypothetical protein